MHRRTFLSTLSKLLLGAGAAVALGGELAPAVEAADGFAKGKRRRKRRRRVVSHRRRRRRRRRKQSPQKKK
jgi:hypothetical protein